MKKYKILFYNRAINAPEGPSVHARELLKAFEELPAEVYVYPKPMNIHYLKKNILSQKTSKSAELIKEFFRLVRGAIQTGLDLAHLFRIIVRHRVDFIVTRCTEYNVAAILAQQLFGVPVLTEVNSLNYIERIKLGKWNFSTIRKIFEKLTIEISAGIYVVSKELIQLLSDNDIYAKKLAVIPNGVDIHKFDRKIAPHPALLHLKENNQVIIGFIGSLYPWHGVDILLKAYADVIKAFPNVALVIVGDGHEKKNLLTMARELGVLETVEFSGSIPHKDIPAYIAGFDLTVAPYNVNGTFYFSPLKVYEYMAMAKPVVCSRLGQLEALFSDSKGGLLVQQGDPIALSGALLSLLHSGKKREEMGIEAYEKVQSNFTWNAAARKVIDLYREIAEA